MASSAAKQMNSQEFSSLAPARAHPWASLQLDDPQTNLGIAPWPHQVTDEDIATALENPDLCGRWMAPCDGLVDMCRQALPPSLARCIAEMIEAYDAFMQPGFIRLRLEAVRGKACWKWHCDYTTLRLIGSLHGPSTQYLPDPNDTDHFKAIDDGHFGLFKGRLYGPGHAPVVHRSAPTGPEWDVRLVVVIDTPNAHEIDHHTA